MEGSYRAVITLLGLLERDDEGMIFQSVSN
jgi:hypothetical protein